MVVSVCESNVGEAGVGRYVYSTELGQGQREWWSLGVTEYWEWWRSVSDRIELPLT